MSEENKERRCKLCGKLLLDERIPFCRRCFLEGRNKVGKVGSAVGGTVMAILGVAALSNNKTDNNEQT